MKDIVYFILTTHKNKSRHTFLEETWLKGNDYAYYSDAPGSNTIKVSDDDSYHSNEEKQINILNFVINNMELKHPWLCFCDDDTFIYSKNLDNKVKTLDDNMVYGQVLSTHAINRYPSGGAGWLISSKLLKSIKQFKNYSTGFSDVSLGLNFRDMSIDIKQIDEMHGQPPAFYNITDPQKHISFHYIKTAEDFRYLYNKSVDIT
jgi:hypothetical protein